jgi:hypothetical protein
MIVPERRAGVVVLMNIDGKDARGPGIELMKIAFSPGATGK